MIHRFLLAARPKNPLHHGLLPVAVVLAISGTSCTPEMKDAATASERSPLEVSRQSKLVSSDRTPGDSLGSGVSIDSDTAAVGAFLAPVGGLPQAGAVYVFVRASSEWAEQAKLTAKDAAAGAAFGTGVSLSGDTLLVGAPYADSSDVTRTGKAYVFVRSGTIWTRQAELVASDRAEGDFFGGAVRISGNVAIIGAENASPAGLTWAGAAYVFVRSGTTWTQQAKLTAADKASFDLFGSTVALDGGSVLIGAYNASPGGTASAGAAYVFTRSGSSWAQQAKLVAADAATNDAFGWAAALSKDTALIGAPVAHSGSLANVGAAYVFTRTGASWTQKTRFSPADGEAGDYLGSSVALDTERALVGAPTAKVGGFGGAGKVYQLARLGSSWTEKAQLTAFDAAAGDSFGAVSLSGETALIGAPQAGLSPSGPGAAYVVPLSTKQANGTSCAAAADCGSGFCADGVCCDSACGGSAKDCQACSIAAGAAKDGTCGNLAAGVLCRTATGVCDAAESCTGTSPACGPDVPLPDGSACSSGSCQAGLCRDEANLRITLSAIPNTATGIDPITLRATISNLGPSSADQVTAYVGLPSGATLKSYSAPGWSCAVTVKSLTCLRSSLARGGTSSLLAVVIPPRAKKQFVLSGEVEDEVFDPVLSNNSVQLTVINPAPIP